jgi:hypothetical protein
MKLFDKLYNAAEGVKATFKKPGVAKKVKRSFEAAIDSMEYEQIDEKLAKLDELRIRLANGETAVLESIVELRREIDDATTAKAILVSEQKKMFDEDVEEEEGGKKNK